MAAAAPQQTSQQRSAEPSMEEILASIRKIIAEDQKALDAKDGTAALPLEAAPAVNDDQADDVLDLSSLDPPAAPVQASLPPVMQSVAQPAYVPPPPVQPAYAPQPEVAAAQPESDRLLSDTTAQTTGAAFHSLANAVFAQQSRTLDELVSEMLRPMLSAWLDDHLPALVERLVKAEIERVARGGR